MAARITINAAPGSTIVPDSDVGSDFIFANEDDAGVVAWKWEILDAPLNSGVYNPLPAASFGSSLKVTPDVYGGAYRVRLTTYRDVGLTDVDGTDTQELAVRFPTPFDWYVPAAGERAEQDLQRGWAKTVNRILADLWGVEEAGLRKPDVSLVAGSFHANWDDLGTRVVRLVLDADATAVTFVDPQLRGDYTLLVYQADVAAHTIANWPANVLWKTTVPPLLSTTPGYTDIYRFYFDGTNYREMSGVPNEGAELKDRFWDDGSFQTYPPHPMAGEGYYFGHGEVIAGDGLYHAPVSDTVAGFATPDMFERIAFIDKTKRLLDYVEAPAHGAFSAYRKLRRDYYGPFVTVRRTDGKKKIIFPTSSGLLDTAAIAAFCGIQSGFVTQWWDHSLLECHLNSEATSAQSKIYDGGTGQVLLNALPALRFDGASNELDLYGFSVGLFKLGGAGNSAISPDVAVACALNIRSWAAGNPTVFNFVSNNGLCFYRDSANAHPNTSITLATHVTGISAARWEPTGGPTGVNSFIVQYPGGGRYDAAHLRWNGADQGASLLASGAVADLRNSIALGTRTFSLGSSGGADRCQMDCSFYLVCSAQFSNADITVIEAELAAHKA